MRKTHENGQTNRKKWGRRVRLRDGILFLFGYCSHTVFLLIIPEATAVTASAHENGQTNRKKWGRRVRLRDGILFLFGYCSHTVFLLIIPEATAVTASAIQKACHTPTAPKIRLRTKAAGMMTST